MSEYPLHLYRAGSQFNWDGRMTDAIEVADEDEELAAEGWVRAEAYLNADPLDHDGDGKKGGSRPRKAAAPSED